jgi:hypothetical protein
MELGQTLNSLSDISQIIMAASAAFGVIYVYAEYKKSIANQKTDITLNVLQNWRNSIGNIHT